MKICVYAIVYSTVNCFSLSCIRICIRMLACWRMEKEPHKRTNNRITEKSLAIVMKRHVQIVHSFEIQLYWKINVSIDVKYGIWKSTCESLGFCSMVHSGVILFGYPKDSDLMRSCWRSWLKRAVQTTKSHTTISVGPYLRDHAINNRAAFIQFLSVVVHGRMFDLVITVFDCFKWNSNCIVFISAYVENLYVFAHRDWLSSCAFASFVSNY